MIPGEALFLNTTVFDWCVSQATRYATQDPERSAQWCLLAADVAVTYGCGALMSPELEECCLRLGAGLSSPSQKKISSATSRKWLHVFTETSPIGGHTALAERWIKLDASADRHSLVVTYQSRQDVAQEIVTAVEQKGGNVESLWGSQTLMEKATKLKALVASGFDAVVLHCHMWDIVPTIAFATQSNVPVVFLNHADHSFWVGASITDLLVNLRDSGREFATRFRGITDPVKLPIPLADSSILEDRHVLKEALLSKLSLDSSAVLILTVGSHFKYEPIDGLANFFDAIERVLATAQNTALIAIGPSSRDIRWAELIRRFPGRVAAVGPQTDLVEYYAAADLYIEGFPFGSLTALLEAGLNGLPCVRAPSTCPAPYKSDGDAVDFLSEPADEDAYSRTILDLVSDPHSRQTVGETLRASISEHHCGEKWLGALEALKSNIRQQHTPRVAVPAETFGEPFNSFWASYLAKRANVNSVAYAFSKALARGLKPKFSYRVAKAIARARRVGWKVPHPALVVVASRVLSTLPNSVAERVYRAC